MGGLPLFGAGAGQSLTGSGGGGGGGGNPNMSFAGANSLNYSGGTPDYTWGNTNPATNVGTSGDPSVVAQEATPPAPAGTTAPGGTQSGTSQQPSWLDDVSHLLFGSKSGGQQGPSDTNLMGTTAFNPTTTQQRSLTRPGDPTSPAIPGVSGAPIGNPMGDQGGTGGGAGQPNIPGVPGAPIGNPMGDQGGTGGQPVPSYPGNAPSAAGGYGGGDVTQGTTAPAPDEIASQEPPGYYGGGAAEPGPSPAPATAPIGSAPISPQSSSGSGKKTATSPAAAPAAAPPTSNYPDIAGSSRESGMAPTTPGYYDPRGGAAAGAGGQGVGGPNLGAALGDLLTLNFGRFIGDLLGQQGVPPGSNYAGTTAPAGYAPTTPGAVSAATDPNQAAAATPPSSPAAAAVRAGYDRAAASERPGQPGEKPALVLRDPSDPSKGYMPDPNDPRSKTATGAPGSTGGPPGDKPTPGDPKQSQSYIASHGGYSETGYNQQRGGYGAYKLNPEFSNRLAAAGQAYEKETGKQPEYGLGDRDAETQRFFWEDSRHGTRYAAAPPNKSLHQQGLAMDFAKPSEFRDWLHKNAGRFGLGFPLSNDVNHIQMQDGRGRAYPYVAQGPDVPATGRQAGIDATGGTIPGSQSPVGTRPGDQFHEPESYVRALFNIEGGGNINARATGSNRGIGQFGPAEEREYGITNRRDINQEARAVQLEARDNAQRLQQAGVNPDPANLYFLHQQGRGGGTALLTADPNTPAWQAINRFYRSPAIAQRAIYGNIPNNNPLKQVPVGQVTAGQFRDMWRNRFNQEMQRFGGTPGNAPGQPSPTQAPATGPVAQGQPIRLASSDNQLSPELAQLVEQQNNAAPPGMPKFSPPPPSFEEDLKNEAYKNWRDPKRLPGGRLLKGLEKGPASAARGAEWLWRNRDDLEKAARTYYDAP